MKLFFDDLDSVEADALADALEDRNAWAFVVALNVWAGARAQEVAEVDAGRVGHLGPVALAKAARYPGDPARLHAALRSSGVIDANGRLAGWGRQAATISKAKRDAMSKRAARAGPTDTDGQPVSPAYTLPPSGNGARRSPEQPETARAAARATHLSLSSGSSSSDRVLNTEERDTAARAGRAPVDPFDLDDEPPELDHEQPPFPPPRAPPRVPVPPKRPRMNRGIVGENERAAEPKTPAELLARSKSYPYAPAKPGEETLGESWGKTFPAYDDNNGRPSLERAIEIGPWLHWQMMDAREAVPRWIWPVQVPPRIEEWLRKAYGEASRSLASQKRAEANGVDVTKPLEKADPVRDPLRAAYRRRTHAGQDLPAAHVWIEAVIREGRAGEVIREEQAASTRAAREAATIPTTSPSSPRLTRPAPPPTDEPLTPEAEEARQALHRKVGLK